METEIKETHELFEVPKANVSLDAVLIAAAGQFGRYQRRMLALAALLAMFTAFSGMEYVFTTARINTRCFIPECESSVVEFSPPWLVRAVPTTDGAAASCQRFQRANSTRDACTDASFDRSATVACSDYVYEANNTIVYDYGLACDEWRRSFVGAAHTTGGLLALPITGYVSDRWGRRAALVGNAVSTAVVGVARYWCASYYSFLVAEIFKATLGGGVFSCAYLLVMELVGPKYRVTAGAALSTCVSSGHIVLGALAWGVPNWRHLILILYVPHFLFISYYWIMSESVRWNMSKGRYKEVEDFLRKVARVNKRELSEKLLQEYKESTDAENKLKIYEKQYKNEEPWLIVLVFQNKEILKRCCIAPIWWITFTLIYYGLSINSVNMAGNRYLNLMVVAASEIPGYWLALLLMDRIGRKPVLIGAFWTCAACQLTYIFLPKRFFLN
ncbi:organic cation transporter protein-like [Bicyclus anynana]|uniref:Organic cation transporter protein-like n=1 Tax=Bicyclus anynana TaxID=110368 RepID=A0ABM3LQ18_BICAN|nr:organic cation transporter protein-like [Bicyclus anynana]